MTSRESPRRLLTTDLRRLPTLLAIELSLRNFQNLTFPLRRLRSSSEATLLTMRPLEMESLRASPLASTKIADLAFPRLGAMEFQSWTSGRFGCQRTPPSSRLPPLVSLRLPTSSTLSAIQPRWQSNSASLLITRTQSSTSWFSHVLVAPLSTSLVNLPTALLKANRRETATWSVPATLNSPLSSLIPAFEEAIWASISY